MPRSDRDAMDQPDTRNLDSRASPCDAVTLEIVRGALRSAQSEMEAVIERTAMSPFIREKKDFYCALFDPRGRLVIGTKLPIFGDVIQPILRQYPADTMRAGDIYWYNDCYGSGGGVSHSPDQIFVAPVFVDGALSAYAQSWAHFTDIGGLRPGSLSPEASEIFHEGIIVPPVRLYREGALNDEVFRTFMRNSRFPQMVRGDTRAATAAVRLGERRVGELFARFGRDVLLDAFDQLIAQTGKVLRRRFRAAFRPGHYRFTDRIDQDGHGNGPFAMRLDLTVSEDRAVLDTSASDDQAPGPVNLLMSNGMPKAVFGTYFLGDDRDLLLNEGVAETIDEVVTRPGSLLQPQFPAPLGLRGLTFMRFISACAGLLNVARPGGALAAWSAEPETGAPFLLSDGIGVGYGARPTADGIDAVYLIAQENYPVEFLDSSYPVRLRRYGINPDSGGPGRWRGGCGVVRELEILADEVSMHMRIDSVRNPPWGVNGGRMAGVGRCTINPGRADERAVAPLSDGTILRRGDILRVETGGGGGWGHPFDRAPARVRADV
ncbi:MAG: hydantoinase B/oxoprolinase family protein, partial [Alphaproteobacteria bacterium]|nr:hydantoinase B/oxoprolinase family protein [Alphaproteobacteria bacterium]